MMSPCSHPRLREMTRPAGFVLLFAVAPLAMSTEPATGIPACAATPTGQQVRLITGAPYSAFGTSETVSTAADGSKVIRQNTVRLWRDSDGRTRSEFSLSSIGGPTPVEINTRLTVIDDPTAGARYLLQPDGRVVVVPIAACRTPGGLEPDLNVGPPRPPNLHLRVSRPVRLGERQVSGETATGSRVEATIPAGAIGNDQPMTMSAEQWYGRDLQVVVEATYRDPRTGETRYRLREIKRKEPDASLFRVPRKELGPR
jgi:hypothetical protein